MISLFLVIAFFLYFEKEAQKGQEKFALILNGITTQIVVELQKMAKKRTIWHLEVSPHLNDQLEDYIEKDAFKTKSEFIRAAVRDRLREENKVLKEQKEEPGEK